MKLNKGISMYLFVTSVSPVYLHFCYDLLLNSVISGIFEDFDINLSWQISQQYHQLKLLHRHQKQLKVFLWMVTAIPVTPVIHYRLYKRLNPMKLVKLIQKRDELCSWMMMTTPSHPSRTILRYWEKKKKVPSNSRDLFKPCWPEGKVSSWFGFFVIFVLFFKIYTMFTNHNENELI